MDKQELQAELKRISRNTYALIGEFLREQPYLTDAGLAEITGCYLRHPGKALRPALVTFACQATGGTEEQARYAAASVEMFHTWTLMADDIIDHDDFRRGQPAAHVQGASLAQKALGLAGERAREFGRGLAMLGSNALEGLAGQMLSLTPAPPEQVLALV
ncbi:MAG: polyprenyl synthetase family protein, partial [Victivallales bacterium]|nr:polyprenyl synthetase family protein [Victivallales bacterium]